MQTALRLPSRWAGCWRTLGTTAVLSVALAACSTMFGARQGTIEYPGSGEAPGAPATYVVKEHDTIDGVAQRYGVPAQTIIERNNLQAPYALKPGQSLALPGARYVPDSVGAPAAAVASAAPSQPAPAPVKREVLAPPGETETPRLAPPPTRATGQPTPLSAPASQASLQPPPAKPETKTETKPEAKAETKPETKAESSSSAPARERFAWPVKGKILVPYGSAPGGQRSDGIDIQARAGDPVKAAEGGTVVYAGSEVAHLGNLLLIQHPGGYITAYGNNEALLVKKGDHVKKGQTIAKAGESGGAASPRVHFEVRQANKPVDPTAVLPPP